jgi:hypothetical protein
MLLLCRSLNLNDSYKAINNNKIAKVLQERKALSRIIVAHRYRHSPVAFVFDLY